MIAGKPIYSQLSSDATVTSYVGTRIFPALAAQNAEMPFITYEVQQITPSDTKDGASTLDEIRVEVVIYAAKFSTAADLAEHTRKALERKTMTAGSIVIESAQFQDAQNEVLDSPRRHVVVQDYRMRLKR